MNLPYFDGVDDYIELPDSDAWSGPANGPFSMQVLINPSALTFPNVDGAAGDKYVNFLSKLDTDNGGQKEWTFRMYSADNTVGRENRISFYVYGLTGTPNTGVFVQEPVNVGEWIRLLVTGDGTNLRLYKNGVLKKTNPYTASSLANGHAPVRVATGMHANNYQTPSYFNGYIDDVRNWNRCLTAQDAMDLENDTFSGQTVSWNWRSL